MDLIEFYWVCCMIDKRMKLVKPAVLFQQALKRGTTKQGRLLGLDVGSKYVGLAVSDDHCKIASPFSVLERTKKNIDIMAKDFQMLVAGFSLAGFVVGYPFNIQGQSKTVQVKLFIEDLRKTSVLDGVSYTYWDENYTSRCVETLLEPLDINPVDAKTIMDKFAAVGILQGYLDNMNRSLVSEDLDPQE
ncbi:GRF domain class transcription factor [Rhynchospora pubera]|uniref:GRF domain class transcription factor n=1 Tax=Rhynchospora pubera TaxID=906938 RepID=A0AAV8CFU5_9POAL|nr:GRF domain class transcription factor [Rhynchospora pubera]